MFAADIAALPAGVLLLNQERSLLSGVKPEGCRRSKKLLIFWGKEQKRDIREQIKTWDKYSKKTKAVTPYKF